MAMRTLDLGDPAPFAGTIGEPRHLAWPVYGFRVTIPTTAGTPDDLNAFERVIVGILDAAGPLDDKALAEDTCIPLDLVRSVVQRLQDREIIDSSNRLTVEKRNASVGTQLHETFRSMMVFQDRLGGQVFPFLKALDREGALATKDSWIDLKVAYDGGGAGFPAPQPRDVMHAAEQMRKRTAVWGRDIQAPTKGQVRVSRDREPYLLSCQIAVLQSDGEFRIADPFGVGYSRLLKALFQNLLEKDPATHEWMMEWRASLTTARSAQTTDARSNEPFDTIENQRLYPKTVHYLKPGRGRQHRDLPSIYAALEWALFYRADAAGADMAIRQLKAQSAVGYSDWLANLASAIGLQPPRTGFRPRPDGKFNDFLAGRAELETVLAINVVQAESDPTHPLRALASVTPDLITRLRDLTKDRGDFAHGNVQSLSDDVELASDPFMRACVQTLLPSIRFDGTPAPSALDSDLHADLRFDARTSLLSRFTYAGFNRLGSSVQTALISAEQVWLTHGDGDDALSYMLEAYAALQSSVTAWVNAYARTRVFAGDTAAVAAANVTEAGLGKLPSELSSVNSRRVREAVEGNHLSLGASVLALLATAPSATLKAVASGQPDFLTAIAEVIRLRGHGNEPTPMSRDDFARVRSAVLQTIATILDHTQRN